MTIVTLISTSMTMMTPEWIRLVTTGSHHSPDDDGGTLTTGACMLTRLRYAYNNGSPIQCILAVVFRVLAHQDALAAQVTPVLRDKEVS